MATKNGRRRTGKTTAGVRISSMGTYPTSSSSAWCSQCTSSGWRVIQSLEGIVLPFSGTWSYWIVPARCGVWQALADAGGLPQTVRALHQTYRNRPDTVGQPPGAAIWVSNMPALKAKKLGKLPQEKVLLEH